MNIKKTVKALLIINGLQFVAAFLLWLVIGSQVLGRVNPAIYIPPPVAQQGGQQPATFDLLAARHELHASERCGDRLYAPRKHDQEMGGKTSKRNR